MKKIFFVTCIAFAFINITYAQQTIRFTEPNHALNKANQYVRMNLYSQALLVLEDYLNPLHHKFIHGTDFEITRARYLNLLCLTHLKRENASQEIKAFLDTIKYESIRQIGYFNLAKYYYSKGDFQTAIPYYEKSGIHYLTNKEISERNFDLAYSYLVTGELDKVEPLFASVKNIPDAYFKPGNYYHGIMSYYKGNYQDARASFEKIAQEPAYMYVVPFYLAEIDYLTGNKQKSLADAQTYLTQKKKLYFHNELYQLIGQIEFENENYAAAEVNLTKYLEQCESPRREDYFRIGYAQLQQAKIPEAIQHFEKMNKIDDEVSQLAYYHLANAYLMQGDKQQAYNNLLLFTKTDHADELHENADYTLAKLSFDKKDDSWAEKQLLHFLKKYPNSKFNNEAKELMVMLYLRTNRLEEGINQLNSIESLSENLRESFQKANYQRGLQLLNENKAENSIVYFEASLKQPVNLQVVNLTQFCLAEANYRIANFNDAIYYADNFLSESQTKIEDQRKMHLLKSYVYLNNNEKEKLALDYAMISSDTTVDPSIALGTSKTAFEPETKISNIDENRLLVYHLPEQKTNFDYTPIPLKPLALNARLEEKPYMNYVSGFLGNLSTTRLSAGVDASNLLNVPAYFEFARTGMQGKIDFQKMNQTHLGMATLHKIKELELTTKLDYDRSKYYYYGYDHKKYDYSNTDIKQVFSSVGLNSSVKNIILKEVGINIQPSAYVGVFTDKFQAIEPTLKLAIPASKELNDVTKLELSLLANLNSLSVKNAGTQSNSSIGLQPSITHKWKSASIFVAINPTFAQKFHILPKFNVQMPIDKKDVFLTFGYDQHLILNTYKQLSAFNPFMFNRFNVNQSRQSEISAGLHGNFNKNISFTSKFAIGSLSNMPLFINDTAGDFKQFNVIYDKKASFIQINAGVDYIINKNLLAGTTLNIKPIVKLSSNDHAWGYVPAEWNMYGKIKAMPNIVVTAETFFRPGSKAVVRNPVINNIYQTTLSGVFDANLRALYNISPQWNLEIDINNLFNSSYQRWYGYDNFGTNVQVGLTHSFNKPKFIPNNFFK